MLIKARGVAGSSQLVAEFLEMIQPFRFPRSLNERVLREIAAVKQRIENEVVKAGELERNVKLGRGGIREIEFIVQTLQILHAGKIPFLQNSQTIPTLQKLVQYKLLSAEEARDLAEAYFFLRNVEHRLPHVCNISFKYVEGEGLMMGFNKNIAVSSGSACTAGSIDPSHVLTAMFGNKAPEAKSSIRISFGLYNTEDQVKKAANIIAETVRRFVKK